MSDEQLEDIQAINKVLAVDEEAKIKRLNERIKNHQEYRDKIDEAIKSIHTADSSGLIDQLAKKIEKAPR